MRNDAIFVLLAVAAGVLYVNQASATIDENATDSGLWNPDANLPTDTPLNTPIQDTADMTLQQKAKAIMSVITQFESNGQYDILVGGQRFTDFSVHPASLQAAQPVGWKRNASGTNYYNPRFNSSAAGAYQITYPTYLDLSATLGITDFTPASQDAMAYELLGEIGALEALNNDDVERAFLLASSKWASLPGSTAGQNPKSLSVALNAYNNYLS